MIVWLFIAQVFIQTATGVGSVTVTPLPPAQHEISVGHEHTK